MILDNDGILRCGLGVPRMCGDDPLAQLKANILATCSPHVRG